MSIKKYFWDLSDKAVRENYEILKTPDHSKYISRMVTLLSLCDKPEIVFKTVDKKIFIRVWPEIRKYWKKTAHAVDFLAWWETIYESIAEKEKKEVPPDDLVRIGKSIKKLRLEKKMTQQHLADMTGISQGDISRIERGLLNFSIMTLLKIIKILSGKNATVNFSSAPEKNLRQMKSK